MAGIPNTRPGLPNRTELGAAPAAAASSSTPSGSYLDPDTADVTDGGGVTFSKVGDSIQAVVDTMTGSASSNPTTLQKALFWDSSVEVQNVLDLVAEVFPTTTIEESSNITAPVIVVVGWVAVPSGGTPSLANLATYKSRWLAYRLNGPNIQVDAGQDNVAFSWSGSLVLDASDPTDYRWVSKLSPQLYRNLEPQTFFTNLVGYTSYAGTSGAQTFEHIISEGGDDDLNDNDTLHSFFAIGRTATGGSERTVAIQVDNAVVQKAGA